MWGPIKHHRALGIHPGAFVQATAPSTADVQDGVLWVDTSSGPPYALKMWDALAGVWRDVGRGADGAIGPPGAAGTVNPDSCCGTDIPGHPGPDTGDGTVNTPSRCGAASAMATYLEQYYANFRNALVYGIGTGVGLTLAVIIDAAATAATGGLDLPWLALVQPALIKVAQLITGYAFTSTLADIFPVLTTADNTAILKAIYLDLPTTPAGPVQVDSTALSNWGRDIYNATTPAGFVAQRLLQLLIDVPSLGSWKQLAYFGAYQPSGVCAGWALTGASFQGGATLGVSIEQSFRGGATFGVPINNSFRGGATL